MELLTVMYHYIGDENEYKRGIYPVSDKRLEKQIGIIAKAGYSFISEHDLVSAVNNGKDLPKKSCLLTFDDGLKSHYEKAFFVLKRNSVPAVFFVCSRNQTEGRACVAHKIHYLLYLLEPEVFFKQIKKRYKILTGQDLLWRLADVNLEGVNRYDEPLTSQIKLMLNYCLAEKIAWQIVESLFFDYGGIKENDFCSAWYLSVEEIKKMSESGFSFGLHTNSHINLFRSPQIFRQNTKENLKFLQDILPGKKIRGISYPYGWAGRKHYKKEIMDGCLSFGLDYGVITGRKINVNLTMPFLLYRFDTNDIPGGKKPIIDF